MNTLLGIDLGTSSVKALVIDEHGIVIAKGAAEYPILVPQLGYAEQNPERWWLATVSAVRQALALLQDTHTKIAGIGFSGQMHGTVLLDGKDASAQAVGNAIIWADQRGKTVLTEMIKRVQPERFTRLSGTLPAAGFMGATLFWLQKHDPARLAQVKQVVLPKDYLCFRLTGVINTESSDASSTALFNTSTRQWSDEIIQALDLPDGLWPVVHEASEVVGMLTTQAAQALGLPAGIPVVAGCADQPAQAVGNGLFDPGMASVTIGTGGQVFMPTLSPRSDPQGRVHTFCHVDPERWYHLGAMLAAGLSLRWLRDLLRLQDDAQGYQKLTSWAAETSPGADGLIFLPYLVGERSPLMDPFARAGFMGITLGHGAGHMARAVMEGVAFALRQILDLMVDSRHPITHLLVSGNGLKNPVWRQIAADILNQRLAVSPGEEQAGVGAALLAGKGIGLYPDFAAISQITRTEHTYTDPNPSNTALYDSTYSYFKTLYPALKREVPGQGETS